MYGLVVYIKEELPLHETYFQKTLQTITYVFDWLYFTQCLLLFPLLITLFLFIRFQILFHLTQMNFSQSTHLVMCLSFKTLMPIITTGLAILMELIDLMNSVIISNNLTQITNFPTWIPD